MIEVRPMEIDGQTVMAISVQLPKTNLLVVSARKGYIMCGALHLPFLNEQMAERQIVAGRAVGVRSIEDLLEAPLESVTDAAKLLGVIPGMKGSDAILKMI